MDIIKCEGEQMICKHSVNGLCRQVIIIASYCNGRKTPTRKHCFEERVD
jgi:hypothetical protein